MTKTLVLLKPDAVQRNKIGVLISRFEDKGLKIIGLKMLQLDRVTAEKQYVVHKGKPFFASLLKYVMSGPVVVMVIEGDRAIEVVRKMVGATNGANAESGTIRGDYSMSTEKNLIHASDSEATAEYEIPIFFNESELLNYSKIDEPWIY